MKKIIMIVCVILLLSLIGACTFSKPIETEKTKDKLDEKERFDNKIVGIDTGAGVMMVTNNALDVYDLDYELVGGSDTVMTTELQSAIDNEEWIVATGWTPHWKFNEWDLKFLEDPKNIYGESENIHALTRLGLEEDNPDIYRFLSDFYLENDQLSTIMTKIADGEDEYESVKTWMENNKDVVEEWVPEDVDGNKERIEIAYVNWDCSVASTHLVGAILEQELNYEVVLTKAEVGLIYKDIANDKQDAFISAWLPVTQQEYYDKHKENLDDLGPIFEEAKIGLVVPEYVEIDSITEL
ncbi:glycine betaine ABC transporter substrate-binding protein [Natranaerobius trueperi]|uniref:Glycine/betaine ABC transporter n=1 Tax=Natranaerobius trueperi TaxID=759412 RepID=A0A226BW62_9FIRM|nr:glycine betaine ABC transporter substrate-binding protein [Natranaerobius trueperi]OWZ83205.1 glycine/betaine ABC transporter [Natranaerobius trueperi]